MVYGAPGRIRTSDPLVRSQVLYPTELRARETWQNNRAQLINQALFFKDLWMCLCFDLKRLITGGERGIRTLDEVFRPHTPLAGERLRPARPSLRFEPGIIALYVR